MTNIDRVKPYLTELKTESHTITREIADIAQQIQDLETRLERRKRDRDEADRKFEACLGPNARKDCLAFMTAFHNKLPREIRDICYSYACLEDQPIAVWPRNPIFLQEMNDKLFVLRSIVKPSALVTCFIQDIAAIQPPTHVLDPAFVGPAVGVEMAEVYYSQNTFDICVPPGGSRIESRLKGFLDNSPFMLGFRPMKLVRRLRLQILCNDFDAAIRSSIQGWRQTEDEAEKSYMTRLHGSIAAVSLLAQKHQLQVEFIIQTAFEDDLNLVAEWDDGLNQDRCFANIIMVLEGPVYKLKHAGAQVAVKHHNLREAHRIRNTDAAITSQDLTSSFWMDASEWQREKGIEWTPSSGHIPRSALGEGKSAAEIRECEKAHFAFVLHRWHLRSALPFTYRSVE